ncbi:PTS system, glucose subfamily, IIA component [Alkalithermobacter thermoalcaliphilus JW-YL-7 = DSM 7308]|uniref:PTS system, glucose subfamily, IIA component n=1 Tax=Alkalithermobacter thermoalcaliphilus JW-YL-7 = DSM 7308 TaxID=1121328 RepID=A0A150FRT9_CLOPD|nr:PTS system, glucose subfamily, IIA subunit [[Clostridium] paradoxum JW-YL-7 = DSM 7308]SHK37933.1 PTS system, glucose subfamily, IIA component [[Clostridium] paradoxum JW-YL-7 = DSM 7308]
MKKLLESIKNMFSAKDSSEIQSEKQVEKSEFLSPISGKILSIEDVPDKVFSQRIMGDGFAIDPSSGEVVSPVNGEVSTLFHTKHAIGLTADDGTEVLIHFGIDTVNMGGEGFEALVSEGDKVKAGQLILKVDIDKIKDKVPSLITPVIFTNLPEGKKIEAKIGAEVKASQKDIVSIV